MATVPHKRAEIGARTSARLSREDWLAGAMDVLAKKGNAGLTIDALAASLGVTKGSFYWHFRDRADFRSSLLEHWAFRFTEAVVEEIEQLEGDPRDRLLAVMELLAREGAARYDVAMRAWAAQDAEVAKLVRRVDELRIRVIGSLFAEMGFEGLELEMRTRTFVVFQSSEYALLAPESDKQRRERLRLRHALLTRPL